MKFSIGQRVKLIANEEEGWEEEFGLIIEFDDETQTYIVEVDDETGENVYLDGIREVHEDFMVEAE